MIFPENSSTEIFSMISIYPSEQHSAAFIAVRRIGISQRSAICDPSSAELLPGFPLVLPDELTGLPGQSATRYGTGVSIMCHERSGKCPSTVTNIDFNKEQAASGQPQHTNLFLSQHSHLPLQLFRQE
jgi:hypothetical protein